MKILQELKELIEASFETGKKVGFLILLGNLALIFGYILQGYSDVSGLLVRMLCISMFIPVILTIRNHFSGQM